MSEFVQATLHLYRDTFAATVRSFTRAWLITLAVVIFAVLMIMAGSLAGWLGMIGGLLLGIVNALLIGATLSLIEESVKSSRTISFHDVGGSFGHYFWDVIGVGFVLWLPVWALENGMAANPYGPFLSSAIYYLNVCS